ncbi:MAG: SGNH/GDSL hydrolase family protein [Gammaproteobacteria bacterium]|nr:SGNH/GDSL hydrolase family protein [Gammaproteobacteria bacterium]
MKSKNIKLTGLIFACAVMSACSNSDVSSTSPNNGTASKGEADFTNYVAVGDSLTAGYTDGALYLLGQTNSYPAILAQQFAAVGGGAFEQPLVGDNQGGLLFNGNPNPAFDNRLVLSTVTQTPERLPGAPTTEVIGSGLNGMTFNNMGVPGAKSFHLLVPGFGNPGNLPAAANPYFIRFSSDLASNALTLMDDVAAQIPSFFTLWIGNNDVLDYATSGGDGSALITPTAIFDDAYAGIVGTMTAANPAAKGVLINIPDVSTIPFFTTVPYNPIPMDQAQADAANAGYVAYNAGIAQALAAAPDEVAQRTITFVAGQNAVVIEDEDLTDLTGAGLPNIRQATASDLIVLPASAIIGTEKVPGDPASVIGVGVALEDGDVLIPSEIQAVATATLAYNTTIEDAASANANLVFFDAAAVMAQLNESGINFGTGSINADFATGGAFGLDGVHPTGRGYAVVANNIINVINTGFNANVFQVDPAAFPAIFLK